MKNIKIYINNNLVSLEECTGYKQLKVTATRQDGEILKAFSNELVFTGSAYNLIKQYLIDANSAALNYVEFRMEDVCCNTEVFKGLIKPEGVKWCDDVCSVTCTVIKDDRLLTGIKNTMIWDNWNGFLQKEFPKMWYAIEIKPDIIYPVIIAIITCLCVIITTILIVALVVYAVVTVISAIIATINSILGTNILGVHFDHDFPGVSWFEKTTTFIIELTRKLFGTGFYHPSPLVRDYIDNVCGKLGLQWQSSIYKDVTSEYYNAVLIYAPVKRGATPEKNRNYIEENAPIWTLADLLDKLKPVHDAEYVIINGVLYFDRREIILSKTKMFDFTSSVDKTKLGIRHVCYNWNGNVKPSYANLHYAKDAIELCGNEAHNKYNDLIEWNPSGNKAQSGKYEPTIEFSPTRFLNDGEAINWMQFIASSVSSAISSVIGEDVPVRDIMLWSQHTCYNPKLVIWDANSGIKEARAKRYATPVGYPNAEHHRVSLFNYPYLFKSKYNFLQKNLYDFHKDNDPNIGTARLKSFELTFDYNCTDISKVDIGIGVQVNEGLGEVTEYEIDYILKTIKLKGIV
jgi:hypothetical protein